jgi:hypothetical protein
VTLPSKIGLFPLRPLYYQFLSSRHITFSSLRYRHWDYPKSLPRSATQKRFTSKPTRFYRNHRTTMINCYLYKPVYDTVCKRKPYILLISFRASLHFSMLKIQTLGLSKNLQNSTTQERLTTKPTRFYRNHSTAIINYYSYKSIYDTVCKRKTSISPTSFRASHDFSMLKTKMLGLPENFAIFYHTTETYINANKILSKPQYQDDKLLLI